MAGEDIIVGPGLDENDETNSGDTRYAGPEWDHTTRLQDLQDILTPGGLDGQLQIRHIPDAVCDTVQKWLDNIQSAGAMRDGDITDNADGSCAVAAGCGFCKISDSELAPATFISWNTTDPVALVDGASNTIYVDYNAGSPTVNSTTNPQADINHTTKFTIGRIWRDGTTLHIVSLGGTRLHNTMRRMHKRARDLREWERATGMVTSETGTRNIAVTAGVQYAGINRFLTSAFDSSGADRFTYWYLLNGTWTQIATQAQIDNTQYNDVSTPGSEVLATLTANNRYGVHWVFMDHDSHVQVLYGQGNYTLNQALDAVLPASLPDFLDEYSLLIAKIVIQKNSATFHSVETAFEVVFPRATAGDHNDLGGLQGGTANQYYHFTATEHTELHAWLDDVTLSDGGSVDLGTGTLTADSITDGTATITGGNFTGVGDVTLDNTKIIKWKDSGGTARDVIKMLADNHLYVFNDAAGCIIFYTDNHLGAGNLVARLTLTNGAAESCADWNNIKQKDLKLENALDANSQSITNVSTIAMTGYIDFSEIAKPANPAADVGRLYSKDDGGVTKLYFLDSAGSESNLLAAAGAGDVVGPAGATDHAVARYDTATGKLIQDSVVIVSDAGAVTGVTTLVASGAVTVDDLLLYDTNASHTLTLHWNEDEAGANRTLNFVVGGADRTLTMDADITASGIVNKSLFDADTFLYAAVDNTPAATSPADVLAALSGHAAAGFAWNGQALSGVGTIGCGAITSTGASQFGTLGVGIAALADRSINVVNSDTAGIDYGVTSSVGGAGGTVHIAYYAAAGGATTNYCFQGDGGGFYMSADTMGIGVVPNAAYNILAQGALTICVLGQNQKTDGTCYAVYGQAITNNTGTNYGIYGEAANAGAGDFWAGYFEGKVHSTGCITDTTCELFDDEDAITIIKDIYTMGSDKRDKFNHTKMDLSAIHAKYPFLVVEIQDTNLKTGRLKDKIYGERLGAKSDLLYRATIQQQEKIEALEARIAELERM